MNIPDPALRTRLLPADSAGLDAAAALLDDGACVAFPTETVYGLGGDATQPLAVARIYAAKSRPAFNPLIAHVPDLAAAAREGVLDRTAEALARAFWPGPLTLIVPRRPEGTVCDLATAGMDSVALRVPSHPVALSLLQRVGRPVAAPSANRSGRVSPTTAAHVLADLDGVIAAVVDGGASPVGVESTIVACLDGSARLLRPGGITRDAIEAVLGRALDVAPDSPADRPLAPGLLASHYAPVAPVRLDAVDIRPGEAALLFGPQHPVGLDQAVAAINLSPGGDLVEAAAALFAALRQLDALAPTAIAVVRIPALGLGEAIRDRLMRAAAPRV
ncbi:MAG: L-threonylcarbamoyladenylate synthase [Alsobacter sp.]